MLILIVYIPVAQVDAVKSALFEAGAGAYANYDCCCWQVLGQGQFRPGSGANPFIGEAGRLEQVAEYRVEMVCEDEAIQQAVAALRQAHPYEEPAFDVVALAPLPAGVGIGRIGVLPEPETLARFVARAGALLPATSWGVRAAGDPDAMVSRVAVSGGSGDSLLATAARAGVDVYLTSDLRHHPADEQRRTGPMALVDVAHWASEFPWCAQAAGVLRSAFGERLPVDVCDIRTDPWNLQAESKGSI